MTVAFIVRWWREQRRSWCQGALAGMVGIFALVAIVGSPATTASATSSGSKMAITTNVTTTLQNFEFNAYFGPAVAQISCELDHNFGNPQSKPFTDAYCMSYRNKLVHNVRLSASGKVVTCVGPQCGSNPGLGTPDFSPGTRVRSGPFTCTITTGTVNCTVASGKGFSISQSAIKRLRAK